MTDDLVKRLRFGVALDEQGDVSWCNQEAMHNAADRIEQLETALKHCIIDRSEWLKEARDVLWGEKDDRQSSE